MHLTAIVWRSLVSTIWNVLFELKLVHEFVACRRPQYNTSVDQAWFIGGNESFDFMAASKADEQVRHGLTNVIISNLEQACCTVN